MSFLKEQVVKFRFYSLILFFFPLVAILGSLFFHNFLLSQNFVPGFNYNDFENVSPIKFQINKKEYFSKTIFCNKDNNFCLKPTKTLNKLHTDCSKNLTYYRYKFINSKKYPHYYDLNEYEKILNKFIGSNEYSENNSITFHRFESMEQKNTSCVNNSKIFLFYKVFPQLIYFVNSINQNEKYTRATADIVNPFLYGETSISNIAKRYPTKFIFKPFLFIASFFMILYWLKYNNIIQNILNEKKINYFLIFGVLSGIFLFFHVLFLGIEDGDLFQKIRKAILLFFIFFELIAQFFLVKKFYNSKTIINNYINLKVLKLKFALIWLMILTTIFVLTFYHLMDPPSFFINLVEWNYFTILLFFYLFSYFIWNKKIN